jgi:hypothetical protein
MRHVVRFALHCYVLNPLRCHRLLPSEIHVGCLNYNISVTTHSMSLRVSDVAENANQAPCL